MDNQKKSINCRIECYFIQNYNIPIIIDSPIIPINFIFVVSDFLLKLFRPGYIEVLFPIQKKLRYKF